MAPVECSECFKNTDQYVFVSETKERFCLKCAPIVMERMRAEADAANTDCESLRNYLRELEPELKLKNETILDLQQDVVDEQYQTAQVTAERDEAILLLSNACIELCNDPNCKHKGSRQDKRQGCRLTSDCKYNEKQSLNEIQNMVAERRGEIA